jgi:DnaD/phage-associated family protein
MSSPYRARKGTDPFGGFIEGDSAIPIPSIFFNDLLPRITSFEELHVTLNVLQHVQQTGGLEVPVAETTLVRDASLRQVMKTPGSPREPDRRIQLGLDLAVARGSLLRFSAVSGRTEAVWYYVNTNENRSLLAAMTRGSVAPPRMLWHGAKPPEITPELPNAFRLYEQNIGPLTPLLADQIGRAIEDYPAEWIEEAIGEAVAYNRRNWRYISRILENWSVQGKGDQE